MQLYGNTLTDMLCCCVWELYAIMPPLLVSSYITCLLSWTVVVSTMSHKPSGDIYIMELTLFSPILMPPSLQCLYQRASAFIFGYYYMLSYLFAGIVRECWWLETVVRLLSHYSLYLTGFDAKWSRDSCQEACNGFKTGTETIH